MVKTDRPGAHHSDRAGKLFGEELVSHNKLPSFSQRRGFTGNVSANTWAALTHYANRTAGGTFSEAMLAVNVDSVGLVLSLLWRWWRA